MAKLNITSLIGLSAIMFSGIAAPAQALLRTEFEDFVRNSNTELAQIFAEKGYAFADELSRVICHNLSDSETTDVYRELIQSGIPPSGASQILSFSTRYKCVELGSQVFIRGDRVAMRNVPSTENNEPIGYYQIGDTAILQSISADGQWGLLRNGRTRYWVHMDYIGFDI